MSESNIMKNISLNKVVLNIGIGKSGNVLESAKKALDQITKKKSCMRNAKSTQREWGTRKGEPIATSITVRGDDAKQLLKRILIAKKNQIKNRSFDEFGNVSFGILEHIDIPEVKYDPNIGIFGMNVSISLARAGFNIKLKYKRKIGMSHRITTSEAKKFMIREFGVELY